MCMRDARDQSCHSPDTMHVVSGDRISQCLSLIFLDFILIFLITCICVPVYMCIYKHVDPLDLELQMGMKSSTPAPPRQFGSPLSWVGFQLPLIRGASQNLGLFRSYGQRSQPCNGHQGLRRGQMRAWRDLHPGYEICHPMSLI